MAVIYGPDGAKLSYDAEEIDERLGLAGGITNRNLLDNPFFTVNQRGQTSYSNVTYTVDRWLFTFAAASRKAELVDNGIKLTNGSAATCYYKQKLEGGLDTSKTYTVSMIIDGNLVQGSGVGTAAATTPLADGTDAHLDAEGFIIQIPAGASHTVTAVKLEYGEESTLENDAPPNYSEELLKCQRYLYTIGTPGTTSVIIAAGMAFSTSEARFRIASPTEMRDTPIIDRSSLSSFQVIGSETFHSVSNVVVLHAGKDIYLRCTTSDAGLSVYETSMIRVSGASAQGGKIIFSAEL